MAIHEYDCAHDLLGKSVHLARRMPGLTIEVYGVVQDVSGSVPGDPSAGSLQVLWEFDSESLLDWYSLSDFVAE